MVRCGCSVPSVYAPTRTRDRCGENALPDGLSLGKQTLRARSEISESGRLERLVSPASRFETRNTLRCLVRTDDWMNFKCNQVDPVSHPLIEKRSI